MGLQLGSSALAEKKECPANFHSIPILQLHRLGHCLLIHEDRSFTTDKEIFMLLAFHNCMEICHTLIPEQAHIALLSSTHPGLWFNQQILLAFTSITTLRANHHQPPTFEHLP